MTRAALVIAAGCIGWAFALAWIAGLVAPDAGIVWHNARWWR